MPRPPITITMPRKPRKKSGVTHTRQDQQEERFIDRFDVLLLDLGDTFMFDADRFGEDVDFYETYQHFGGKDLNGYEVKQILTDVYRKISAYCKVSENCERIPPLAAYFKKHPAAEFLPAHELDLLEKVFTEHEIGSIPERYTAVLKQLATTHRLGIISDIWSRSDRFYQEFEKVGIRDLFKVIVFSSDIGIFKPSPKIFRKAVEALDADISRVVYIGDSLRRDVVGAKAIGMSVIWIKKDQAEAPEMFVEPDLTVTDLQDIL